MYLMIDNYDSFVYNLVAYLNELGEAIKVVKNDEITIKEIENMKELKGIIISSGSKSPKNCGISGEIVRRFKGEIPVFGVCLGHHIIGYEYGANIEKGDKPMHGKVTDVVNTGKNLFRNLPKRYKVTRYHSLVIDEKTIPSNLTIDAVSEDGVIMAVSDQVNVVYGVQFNPEAVLTEYGHELLKNYVTLCEEWWLSR
ncbi:MAG: aminodeoxychorismate/anthranilate synthase component II [Clostridia bacterium]|nr:aminodeoxychorismate/anthranilate synthase component II [Clostridia bacterium]